MGAEKAEPHGSLQERLTIARLQAENATLRMEVAQLTHQLANVSSAASVPCSKASQTATVSPCPAPQPKAKVSPTEKPASQPKTEVSPTVKPASQSKTKVSPKKPASQPKAKVASPKKRTHCFEKPASKPKTKGKKVSPLMKIQRVVAKLIRLQKKRDAAYDTTGNHQSPAVTKWNKLIQLTKQNIAKMKMQEYCRQNSHGIH